MINDTIMKYNEHFVTFLLEVGEFSPHKRILCIGALSFLLFY